MQIPACLTLEKPLCRQHKRGKSDDISMFDSNEFRVENDDSDSLTSSKPLSRGIFFLIFTIFGIGFTLGQIFPSLIHLGDEQIVFAQPAAFKWPTQSPSLPLHTWSIELHPSNSDLGQKGSSPTLGDVSKSTIDSIFLALQGSNLTAVEKANTLPEPNLENDDEVALYSQEAHKKLISSLKSDNKVFRICINGGSSSAGGGFVDYEDLFFVRFAQEVEKKYQVTTEVVNRAHGDRNSMHSAFLGDSFFVPDTDLIIWEFSINDQIDGGEVESRNEMILWLRKIIDIYGEDPPAVLLVYLWNKPFSTSVEGSVMSDVYKNHAHLGAKFDFVLGHVNLASYMDSLQWSPDELSRFFLADSLHPNALSHAIISRLMFALLVEAPKPIVYEQWSAHYEWTCGDDMIEQWEVLEIFLGDRQGVSKASFTADVPRNPDGGFPGMLAPFKEKADGSLDLDSHVFSTQRYGLARPGRIDRHRGVSLPCCREGKLIFEVSGYAPVSALQVRLRTGGVEGGSLGSRRLALSEKTERESFDSVDILVNGKNYRERLVSASEWNCLLSHDLFSTWLVLDRDDADQIAFCDNSDTCGTVSFALEHMAVF